MADYRFDNKQKILSFGRYPEVSLAEARKKCFEARQLLEAGRDPNVVKKEEKAAAKAVEREEAMIFEAVAEQWFEKEYSDCPPKTAEKIRWHLRILNQHIGKIPLILMPDKVLETIALKYFKRIISYKGIPRVETYPIPREAIRKAILNAIVHRDYSRYNPIHIRVYDKVRIDNDGTLPNNWTVESLMA